MATSLPVGSSSSPFLGFCLESVSWPGNNTTRVRVKTSAVGDYWVSTQTVLKSVTVRDFADWCFKKQELTALDGNMDLMQMKIIPDCHRRLGRNPAFNPKTTGSKSLGVSVCVSVPSICLSGHPIMDGCTGRWRWSHSIPPSLWQPWDMVGGDGECALEAGVTVTLLESR